MNRTKITMQHTEETVHRLARVQYDTFHGGTKILLYGLSVIGILMGFGLVIDIGIPWRYFPMMLGCIVFANVGVTARTKAKKTLAAIKQQGGEFPFTTMDFGPTKLQITEKDAAPHSLDYNKFVRLVEDEKFLYFFVTTEAAYMVPADQVGDRNEFKQFIEKRTNQSFQYPVNLMTLNLKSMRQARMNKYRDAARNSKSSLDHRK